MIKGRKCKVAASEFVVKISNRFDVLKEDGEDTQHASKVINSYIEQNSSSRELIKPIKSVDEGFDKSITKGKIKASEPTKKYSIQHSSESFGWIQASKSEDCVEVNRSKVRFSDQQLTSADQGYIVNVRKRNKKKFPQHTFKYKKVEMIKDDNLEQFETPNLFKLLDIMTEDCPERMDLNVNMKSEPKHMLKKCRYCNYKKRLCAINSSSCVARIKKCVKCGKGGHYPQSMCCKASKTSQKVKVSNNHKI